MSNVDVSALFPAAAEAYFDFLTAEAGFVGPERQEDGAYFYSPDFSVEVLLDRREGSVVTLLGAMVDGRHLRGGRIQPVEAFASTSSANTSEGFFQWWILRGRSLISEATIAR